MPQQTVPGNRGDDQLHRRLQHLTGSEQVRLNDRDYMNLLHDRLEDEYMKQQSGREKKLREEEIRRIRRLKREGVIDDVQYQDEMAHIQRHGVGSEHFGGPPTHDEHGTLVFPLLTDGNPDFTDNPDAITYRGYYEDPAEVEANQQRQQNENAGQSSQSNDPNASSENKGGEQGQPDGEEGQDKKGTTSPRYSRPQSVTVQQLNDADSVASMYEMAKGMVFIEVGLNPPRRKGGKANNN